MSVEAEDSEEMRLLTAAQRDKVLKGTTDHELGI